MHWTGQHHQKVQGPEVAASLDRKKKALLQPQSQRWQNQNKFLQDRHGPSSSSNKRMPCPEVITVGMPTDGSGFDLLCWTINMAARPRDTVIAIRSRLHYDAGSSIEEGHEYEQQESAHFKPLRDLCNVKQVQLQMRCSVFGSAERWVIEEALLVKATMLVVTTSGHHLLRHAQRRGRFLATHVPVGCSILVVKDFKILFYEDNQYKDLVNGTCPLVEKVVTPAFQCSAKQSGSQVFVREVETSHHLDSTAYKKVWPELPERSSPRRVLDGPDTLSDSDESPGSSVHGKLQRSSSRKALIARASSHGEEDMLYIKQSQSCLPSWRGVIMRRSQTFPPVNQTIKTSFSLQYRALGSSLKSCLSSLWGGRDLKRGNPCPPRVLSKGGNTWRSFTFNEVLAATNCFSQGNLVGRGGHAEVYKGLLSDGQRVAVKRLIRGDTEEQKIVEFLTELGMICHISHPNVTALVGFCIEKGLHLVFRFLRHGSLASWLHGGKLLTIEWAVRYRVAVGTARGLNYLHTGCQRRVIHRDIKASNILLGPDFEPQISDFGLAKWLPNQCSHHILTPIEGTFGYLAPEYFMHGVVDEKTDVFAFGVLLLELITGRRPIEGSQSSLVMWARPLLESLKVEELVDTRLHGDYDPQEMQCMMMTAALCVQQSPICRPTMSQVLELLTDEVSSDRADSLSMLSSQSMFLQDPTFDSDYSCTNYRNDLRRHREIALQF